MDDMSNLDDAHDTAALPARRRLDVDAYYRMGDVGILAPDDRTELIDGEIIDMAPIGSGHAGAVALLTRALVMACGDKGIVWVQNPVRLDRSNQPQPDLAVLRPRDDFYASALPGPADAFLLIEVADSSVEYDKTVKLPLYTRFGIPEYWLLNVQERVLEAYRLHDGNYGEPSSPVAGERLPLAVAPDIIVTIPRLFG